MTYSAAAAYAVKMRIGSYPDCAIITVLVLATSDDNAMAIAGAQVAGMLKPGVPLELHSLQREG